MDEQKIPLCPFCDAAMGDRIYLRRHVWRLHKVELAVLSVGIATAVVMTVMMLVGGQPAALP
jgi:hypothetical protein